MTQKGGKNMALVFKFTNLNLKNIIHPFKWPNKLWE